MKCIDPSDTWRSITWYDGFSLLNNVKFNSVAIARECWGRRAADPSSALRAMAYLWRRFGPSKWGCDPHRDLVEYILTTPDPQILLRLTLTGEPLQYAVDWACIGCFEDEWLDDNLFDNDRFWQGASKRVADATSSAMTDLLRPVYIRDVPINILGRCNTSFEMFTTKRPCPRDCGDCDDYDTAACAYRALPYKHAGLGCVPIKEEDD